MKITYDPAKRLKTLEERGLDFADALYVFAGDVREIEDSRFEYGEKRVLCFGQLSDRRVVIGYVQRGEYRHIFSMRKCHEKEWNKIWF
jgi:uncharacterized DUF497 family protein